jgi:hypothetical protein
MIKINLLPVEKRKAERTPLPRFFLIISTGAVAAILAFYILYLLLLIKQVDDDIEAANAELERLKPFVALHDQKTGELAELERKLAEIKGLVSRDVELGWWRAVDALWTVIHQYPKVWIDDLRAIDGRTSGGEMKRIDPASTEVPPYAVTMRCHVAGSEVEEMTKFRMALKDNVVLQETLTTVNFNVDWKVDTETGFSEKSSISFQVTLLAPSVAPKRKAPAPPPTPGAPAVPTSGTPAPPKEAVK